MPSPVVSDVHTAYAAFSARADDTLTNRAGGQTAGRRRLLINGVPLLGTAPEGLMIIDYSQSFRSEEAARGYDERVYVSGGHDAFLDGLQRQLLPPLVAAHFEGTRPTQFDFACGSGRSIEMFADVTREAHGYDVSAEMLARAKQRCPQAHFHLLGERDDPIERAGDRLLTAFRFVLNAPPEARSSFADWVRETAEGTGRVLLVIDNHGNSLSLRTLAAIYRRRRPQWFNTMSSREVMKLLSESGFTMISRHGFGVLPRRLHQVRVTRALVRRIDCWAASQRWLAPVSIDVVYFAVPASSVT